MMKPLLASVCLSAAATAALAQNFDDRWAMLGTFTVTTPTGETTLYALADRVDGDAFIDITEAGPFSVLSLTGAAPGPEGQPVAPYISVSIGPFTNTPDGTAGVEWRDGGQAYYANVDSGTKASLEGFELTDDGQLSFSVAASEMRALTTDANYDYVPVPDVAPIALDAAFSGRLPADG